MRTLATVFVGSVVHFCADSTTSVRESRSNVTFLALWVLAAVADPCRGAGLQMFAYVGRGPDTGIFRWHLRHFFKVLASFVPSTAHAEHVARCILSIVSKAKIVSILYFKASFSILMKPTSGHSRLRDVQVKNSYSGRLLFFKPRLSLPMQLSAA